MILSVRNAPVKKQITGVGMLILALSLGLLAQTPTKSIPHPAPTPTVDQILDRYVQALGGREAILKITSRICEGTIQYPPTGPSGTIQMYAKAPNKSLVISKIAGFYYGDGFDGSVGWDGGPEGVREKSGDMLEDARRDAEFFQPLKLRELYPKITFKGTESINGHDAYFLEATPLKGEPHKMYFNVQSGLLVRIGKVVVGRDGSSDTLQEDLEDYKVVDGVEVPFAIHESHSSGAPYDIHITEVHNNVPIKNAKFSMP